MNLLHRALRKVASMVFPWPPRHERKAAIAQAARNKDRAQAAAAKARSVEAQIVRMTEENHLAAGIAAQIWRKGR